MLIPPQAQKSRLTHAARGGLRRVRRPPPHRCSRRVALARGGQAPAGQRSEVAHARLIGDPESDPTRETQSCPHRKRQQLTMRIDRFGHRGEQRHPVILVQQADL